MRSRLWKTALLLAAVLFAGLVAPAAADDPVTGEQDPASGNTRVPPPKPPNDHISDAVRLYGTSASIRLNRSALGEGCLAFPWRSPRFVGDVLVLGGQPHSIWWKWTPNSTRWVTVDTGLSHGHPFDTVLGVYVGPRPCEDELQFRRLVGWDDDSGRGYMSRVRFRAYAGEQYYFVVDSGDLGGRTPCRVVGTMVGDALSCATTLPGDVVVRLRNG